MSGEIVPMLCGSAFKNTGALAFKIMTDPYVGQLIFFGVYSGVVHAGDAVYNPAKGERERLGRIPSFWRA